jgi:hypothetical protein
VGSNATRGAPTSSTRIRGVRPTILFLAAVVGGLGVPTAARAGGKLPLGPDSELDLGFTAQTHGILGPRDSTEGHEDLDGRLVLRRARLRLGADVTRWFSAQLQTDRGDGDGRLGIELRLIDAFVVAKPHRLLHLYAGLHMAPTSRQNLTFSFALLGFDRPGLAFKSLTWGTRSLGQFGNLALPETDSGLRGRTTVRDSGTTAFGRADLTQDLHLKYYLGAYEGVRVAGGSAVRTTARAQLNLWDEEPAYFNASTYLGDKRTIALGASYDAQGRVARDDAGFAVDYAHASADLFAEHRLGTGAVSFEVGASRLRLGGRPMVDVDGRADTPLRHVRSAEGEGAYAQLAYALGVVQPWLAAERWWARDPTGSYVAFRFGLNHYVARHHANVKLAYEHLRVGAEGGGARSIGALALGVFLFY